MDAKTIAATFRANLTFDEARSALVAFADDKANHGRDRLAACEALLDLRTGRSMQSTMSRFRKKIGGK